MRAYLRTLMVHGARSVMRRARTKAGYAESWLGRLLARRHKNIAACALANHNARVVWALLAHDRRYEVLHRCTRSSGCLTSIYLPSGKLQGVPSTTALANKSDGKPGKTEVE